MSTDEKQEAVRKPMVKDRYKEIVAAEGDKHEFKHAGFQCALVRHPRSGHWCGYVVVGKGSPLHGVDYSQVMPALKDALDRRMQQPLGESPGLSVMLSCLTGIVDPTIETVIRVHGGVTFSNRPYWMENKADLWAFGFDCAHWGDIQPYSLGFYGDDDYDSVYRTREYVEQECRRMAEQLRVVADELAALEAGK